MVMHPVPPVHGHGVTGHFLGALCACTQLTLASFPQHNENPVLRRAGDAVMLVKDPHNPYDPHAVSVRTLDGRDLGFVPRDDTGAVTQPITFGRVEGIGPQKDTGLLGFHVRRWLFPLRHVSLGISGFCFRIWACMSSSLLSPPSRASK